MKTLVCFVLVFCFVSIVAAQERVIDKTEFDAAVTQGNNHYIRWKDEKYRMTVSTSSKAVGRTQTDWSSKIIHEYAPPDQSRTVSSSSFGGKPNPTQESIIIGKSRFLRSGNDSWIRKENEQSRGQSETPESTQEMIGSAAEYRYLGKVVLAGRDAVVYQKTERQTKVNKKNGESIDSETKATYWFGGDGVTLKNEYRSENRGATLTTQTVVIMEWEIDPSIVITAPQMSGDKP